MAAKLDINVDEGSTWVMGIDFWEDSGKTIPISTVDHEFKGSMLFGETYVQMAFTQTSNGLEASIPFADMEALPSIEGKYDIEARNIQTNEKYRVIQGTVRVDREVTIT